MKDDWQHPYSVLARPGVQFTDEQKAQIKHYVFWTGGPIRRAIYKIAKRIFLVEQAQ